MSKSITKNIVVPPETRDEKNSARRKFFKQSAALAAIGLAHHQSDALAASDASQATNPSLSTQPVSAAPSGTPVPGGVVNSPSANTAAHVSGSATKTAALKGYNILFVLVDQERYMGSGWPIPLPAHERLKRTGVYFENHHIASAACTSSRSVIYTGQHMPVTGMFDNAGMPYMASMDPVRTPTIGHILRSMGYFTTYKGKFHLNNDMAMANSPNHFTQLFEGLMDQYGFSDFDGMGDFIDACRGGYQYDATVTAKAITWLRTSAHKLNHQGQPWFMAVNLVNPHDVFWMNTDKPGDPVQSKQAKMAIAPAPDHKLYQSKWPEVPLPSTLNQSLTAPGRMPAHHYFQQSNEVVVGKIPNEVERWRTYQDYYFNCIRQSDGEIETLLKELDDQGLTDSTIVIFTADHGELGGSHGGMTNKGDSAYEEQNHVPLLIVHPKVQGGVRCKAVTSHLDLVPTIMGLTTLDTSLAQKYKTALKGKDFSAALTQPAAVRGDAFRPDGALYCYNLLQLHDPAFTTALYDVLMNKSIATDQRFKAIEQFPVQWNLRIGIRSVRDERYKFSRYFSFKQFNMPRTLEELIAKNDLELYDLQNDPQEVNNLALDVVKNKELILTMNQKLNALIETEIGVDDGSFLKFSNWINWTGKEVVNS